MYGKSQNKVLPNPESRNLWAVEQTVQPTRSFPPHAPSWDRSSVKCIHKVSMNALMHSYSFVLPHIHREAEVSEIPQTVYTKQSSKGSIVSSSQRQKGLETLKFAEAFSPATAAPVVLQPSPRKLHIPRDWLCCSRAEHYRQPDRKSGHLHTGG